VPDERTYPEDEEVLRQLEDPVDVEAFKNLMANAHVRGKSAVEMVREEPGITSRPHIRQLCLRDKGKFFWAQLKKFFRSFGRTCQNHRGLYGGTFN